MKRSEQVRDLVMGLEADFEKFYDKENQAAGTRVRKGNAGVEKLSSRNQN